MRKVTINHSLILGRSWEAKLQSAGYSSMDSEPRKQGPSLILQGGAYWCSCLGGPWFPWTRLGLNARSCDSTPAWLACLVGMSGPQPRISWGCLGSTCQAVLAAASLTWVRYSEEYLVSILEGETPECAPVSCLQVSKPTAKIHVITYMWDERW